MIASKTPSPERKADNNAQKSCFERRAGKLEAILSILTTDELRDQETLFAEAFAKANVEVARPLYHPDVLYLSPTVRLFDWPRRIEGAEKTLEFIGLTVQNCPAIRYEAVELACLPDGASSFVRVHFDWDQGEQRLRSNYVVLYRYLEGLIGQQEIYYDPSGTLEKLGPASGSA